MTGLPPGRRVHQSSTPSGNLTSRTQSSVPSAESYGTLPAEASPLVSRETSPSPEKRLPCRPRQSGSARCHDRICRTSLTDGTRPAPPKADVSATFFRGSSTSYPVGHDVLTGRSPAATLQRHPVGPHLLQHMTCLTPGKERSSRVSSSNLEPRHQFSVTSVEFYGTLPSDASPLVSRETCPRTWCWHHGNANITLQPSLPGKVGTVHSLSVPGMPDTTVSTQ